MSTQQQANSSSSLQKWWLCMVFFALYFLLMFQTETIQSWFTLPVESGGVYRTPWNYINRDFAKGIGSLFLFVTASVVSLIFLKRCWPASWIALVFTGIWCIQDIAVLWLILMNTQNYFDPAKATATWQTWREYFDAREIGIWAMISFGVFASLNAYFVRKKREYLKEETGMYFPPKNISGAKLP